MATQFLPPEDVQRLLSPLAGDGSALVRVQIAGALADLEQPSCRDVLGDLVRDSVPSVRFEAARGLAAIGDPLGIDVLIEALGTGEQRFRALGALASLGDPRAVPAIRALFDRFWLPPYERTQAAGALARFGDQAAARHLIERTRKHRTADRALAIELSGEVKAPGAFERLESILADEEDEDSCRGAAARGLGNLKDRRALASLLRLLEDLKQSDDLRLDAAEGICRLGGPDVRAQVESLLHSLKSAEAQEEVRELLEEYA
jgi:HEAT repeat protein